MADISLTNFDFGFSAVDEEELESLQTAKAEILETSASVATTQDKLNKIYNAITPLLNNLALNPEKDYIYWPNRLEKIEQFRDALDNIYSS